MVTKTTTLFAYSKSQGSFAFNIFLDWDSIGRETLIQLLAGCYYMKIKVAGRPHEIALLRSRGMYIKASPSPHRDVIACLPNVQFNLTNVYSIGSRL